MSSIKQFFWTDIPGNEERKACDRRRFPIGHSTLDAPVETVVSHGSGRHGSLFGSVANTSHPSRSRDVGRIGRSGRTPAGHWHRSVGRRRTRDCSACPPSCFKGNPDSFTVRRGSLRTRTWHRAWRRELPFSCLGVLHTSSVARTTSFLDTNCARRIVDALKIFSRD